MDRFQIVSAHFSGHSGHLPFKCLDGNLTCDDCMCLPVLSTMAPVVPSAAASEISELPVAALAATVTAMVLLLCFAAGLLWHRAAKRKAMAAAVAAAVGDLPVHSVLPKSGTGSHRSVSHSTSAASSGSKPKDDAFELVVDVPMALPLYWLTKDGIHIFPDPNRIGEVQLGVFIRSRTRGFSTFRVQLRTRCGQGTKNIPVTELE